MNTTELAARARLILADLAALADSIDHHAAQHQPPPATTSDLTISGTGAPTDTSHLAANPANIEQPPDQADQASDAEPTDQPETPPDQPQPPANPADNDPQYQAWLTSQNPPAQQPA